LATFRCLDRKVLEHAGEAATTSLDAAAVVTAAHRAGAPVDVGSHADRAARDLLRAIVAGERPRPALRRLLVDALSAPGPPDAGDSIAEWLSASPAERGAVLRDLLDVGDRLPAPRRGSLRFPRLVSTTDG
jgi:hypothetical protein